MRTNLLLGLLATVALAWALFPSGGSTVQAQTEPVDLVAGCNFVAWTGADATPPANLAASVSPQSSLTGLWAQQPPPVWKGFNPAFPEVSDMEAVNQLDVVAVCVTGPAIFERPMIGAAPPPAAPTNTPEAPPPAPTLTPVPPTATTQAGNCDPAYPTVCIPSPPPDLDCGDISERNFQVLPPDPHNFDGDGDGIGCES
jgi:hypothetical protein